MMTLCLYRHWMCHHDDFHHFKSVSLKTFDFLSIVEMHNGKCTLRYRIMESGVVICLE